MTLYNLKHDGDQYRITKFTSDLEVKSSYLLSQDRESGTMECDCPAGHHYSCRHRQMFPDLLPIVDTEAFWHYETKTCVNADGTNYIRGGFSDDIQAFTFDEPAIIHNAIAEAVGEPEAILPPTIPSSWRRI